MHDSSSSNQLGPSSDETLLKDVASAVRLLLSRWLIIVVCVLLASTGAFVLNRYSEDQFEVRCTVAEEDFENPLASVDGLLDFGFCYGGKGIVDTRIANHSYAQCARGKDWTGELSITTKGG